MVIGIFAGGALEIGILLSVGRRVIAERTRRETVKSIKDGEWDEAIERVVGPLESRLVERITEVEKTAQLDLEPLEVRLVERMTDIERSSNENLEAFEGRFGEAYRADMEAIAEDMAKTRSMIAAQLGRLGGEEKAFRAMAEQAESEIEGEITIMEAVAQEDPRLMAAAVGQKIDKLSSDPDWQKKHQIGAVIVDIGKPLLKNWVAEITRQIQGAPALASGRRGGSQGSVYG